MKTLLILLAKVLNALPKTEWKPIPLCDVYYKYDVPIPNLVGHVTAPSVTTDATPSSITTTSAVYDTNSIDSTGNENPSARGICWVSGSGGSPTIANSHTTESGSFSTGNFSATATGLSAGTTYSVRAYATNSAGTGYGSTVEVTTSSNTPPTVSLSSPADAGSTSDTTPDLVFTGTDSQSDDIRYNVQVDTVDTFDSSIGGTPVISDSYVEANQDSTVSVGGGGSRLKVGQSFTGGGNAITSAKFYLSRGTSAVGNINAAIYAHTGTYGTDGTGTGSALATSNNINVATGITTSLTLIEFTFSTPFTTVNGTHYVVAVEYTDATDIVNVGRDVSSATHAGSNQVYTSSWSSAGAGVDTIFYVYETPAAPLLNKTSGTDSGFSGTPDNTDPFTSGQAVTYTVQAGDALPTGDTYYWRVRGIDPSGSNTYGSWSSTRSFTVSAGGTTGQIKVYNGSSFVAKPVKVWNGSSWVTKPLKRWNGSSWTTTPY